MVNNRNVNSPSIEDVCLMSVDDPVSFLYGEAIRHLLRFGNSKNTNDLRNTVTNINLLVKQIEDNQQ